MAQEGNTMVRGSPCWGANFMPMSVFLKLTVGCCGGTPGFGALDEDGGALIGGDGSHSGRSASLDLTVHVRT